MGVTDCHVHINPIEQMRPEALRLIGHVDPAVGRYVRDPSAFLGMLDRAGVERAALINYVAPAVIGYTEATNDFVCAYARTDPERLLAVGGIDVDHPEPEREIARLAEKLGLRAIKLHPPHQLFRPNDYVDGRHPRLPEIYSACARHGLPVIFHTGTSIFPGARSRFGDPLLIEDVAVDHPDLTIVLAHGGRPFWTERAVYLARRFPKVWLEVSGVPPLKLLEYFPDLPRVADKVLFGTDWPGPGVKDIGENLRQFRAIGLSDELRERILEENPLRVFPRRAP